ncbi:phosphoethanolamine transferase [Aggregatibacter actinomycetemcomitans]|uniref:phosphoethanolamine transferase n=1 Tax=Aggregatibacter actinomycetemcomitans TaxID=714 RepID=UPI0011D532C9|nr:phosphoethanolamine transferase [Aggregatibacter actinomycetemcomitans]TYA16476.1 phosphoethanolamine transferase [Aggregatibacter actinomycetemcomitans]
MFQSKKFSFLYNDISFFLLLLLFAFLSHIALGILDNYANHILSILGLGILLFTFKKHSNRLFLVAFVFIFAISFGYVPSGILYGLVSIGVIASVYETNFSETLGFFRAMPISIYFFTALYVVLFIALLVINRHIHSNKKYQPAYYCLYLAAVVLSLYTPVNKLINHTDKTQPFTTAEFIKASDFYPVSFISNAVKVNNTYLTQRDLLNDALTKTPEWDIVYVEPKYQNYVLIIGESMRRDYTSLYGYPQKTTPFLEQVNGLIFNLYVAAGPNTQPSLQRTLYRSTNNNEETVYTDNIISLAKLAHYKTYWLSNQGKVGEWDTMASRIGIQADESFFTKKGGYDSGNTPDTALLEPLKQLLNKDKDQTKLIVLHLIGSHPTFCAHLNGEEPKFHLVSREMSCYLDTLKQTDTLLSEINQILKAQNQSYPVIYFSDHGLAHLGEGKNLSMLNNKEYKQSYAVPFIRFSSDDTKRTVIKNPQSAFNFINGFAQWLGIKETHLSQDDFFNPKPQPIKVFNWRALVDYNSLKEDPAKK